MEDAMASVIQIASSKVETKTSTTKKAIEKTSTSAVHKPTISEEHIPAIDTLAQTKSRITIDFYRNKAGEPIKGRIEHPLSGAKVKFQGYDRNIILSFIEQHIPAGNKHRLINPGLTDLILIEVQVGSYLGEDDIERFSDLYGRN